MNNEESKKFSKLFLRNTLIIFVCLLISLILLLVFVYLSFELGFLTGKHNGPFYIILILFLISLFIASIISLFGAKTITKPIQELMNATNEIMKGNFNIEVSEADHKEFNVFIQNFNKMARELKTNETLKNDFISNVSHEFKTPLSVIQSYSKSLRRNDLDSKTRKHYEEVLDSNIKKLTNLTSNILSLSKIENQQIVPNKTEFLLDEQIRQSILFLEPEWRKKNIDFNLSLPKTKIYGSAELLSQVWQNLIGNAIKFSNQDGKVSIEITQQESIVSVRISDNGIGMNEETMKHIFDKFYQGDKSHTSEGNGLGLTLVSRILKISDGEISVSSKENKGTTFVVTLK